MTIKQSHCTFLISSLAGGGAEGVCANLANGLADQALDIELVVLNMTNSVFHTRLTPKVKLTVLNVAQARHSFLPLIRHLNATKPAQVVVFNYELSLIMVLIRPFLRFDFRLLARNINTFSANAVNDAGPVKRFVINPLIGYLYSRIDHIVNQCEAMRTDLLHSIPIDACKTSVIYNPVNRAIEKEQNKEVAMPEHPYILCVGRLEKQKAFHYAIQAFAELKKRMTDIRLKFVGQGSLEPELKLLAAQLGVNEFVDFEGFSSNLVSYYKGAKLVLLTSLYEGFPNVLVEAITLGIPVVSVDCKSGPSELIIPGVNGFLVSSYEPEKLANAMEQALVSEWDFQQIQTTAIPYSNDRVVDHWLKLLHVEQKH